MVTPPTSKLQILAREYALGHLTIGEIATLLERDVVDVLEAFERFGCGRTIDQIRLSESERMRILREIAEDRAARGGEPAYSRAAVARDTIASERLEGVDARRWILRGDSE